MITVNGERREECDLSVSALLDALKVVPRGVAVAIDGTIVRRSEWDATMINDGAAVEIVTAAAGG